MPYADFTVKSKSKPDEDAKSYLPPADKKEAMTLKELRNELGQWIRANDKFLNRAGVPADEAMKAVDAANEVGFILLEREIVQTPPPTPPSENTYAVRRGKSGTGTNSSTATLKAGATLKDLREFLTSQGFMKPTDWFATPAEIQISGDESKTSAASAAANDTIIIGPWLGVAPGGTGQATPGATPPHSLRGPGTPASHPTCPASQAW